MGEQKISLRAKRNHFKNIKRQPAVTKRYSRWR